MVKSMTGFGRGEYSDERCRITVEMKAVNHRYLDLGIKIPKKLGVFESNLRNILKEYAERGKIDIYVSYESLGEGESSVRYNKELAKEYLKYFKEMEADFGVENDINRVSVLARFPDVLSLEDAELDEETIGKDLETAFRGACQQFVEAREREGEKLKADLLDKLEVMKKDAAVIEERCPQIVSEYKEKLRTKVAELLGDVQFDENRIITEVTIFADKVAVDEELVRLKAHIDAMETELKKGGAVGRKLDFIAQEMNREANTTLSKANDLSLADTAIELKTLIEKIREQIQNLE